MNEKEKNNEFISHSHTPLSLTKPAFTKSQHLVKIIVTWTWTREFKVDIMVVVII